MIKLPLPGEKFICLDPCRQDLHDRPMDNIHIEVWPCDSGIGFFCYGYLIGKLSRICFGFSKTLEGAIEVFNNLSPYEGHVEESDFNPDE